MLARLLLSCALVLPVLAQQPGLDIFTRLRRAPLPAGQGEVLATALHNHDVSSVIRALANAQPTDTSDHAELLCLQGAVNFLAEQMDASASAFLSAEKFTPLNDADAFTLAMAQIKLQQGPAATTRLSALAAKHPQSPLYLYWLGKLDYDQRRYDEAIAKMQRVIQLDPQSIRAYNSLGLAFDMQGKFDPARDALTQAATLNRRQAHPSPWPPHDLGYLLLRMDRLKEAEEALRESLRYDPAFAPAHNHLARVLEKQNLASAAAHEYEQAISLDPASPEPCYSLALLYRKLNRPADADKMFVEFRRRKAGLADGR